MIPSTDVLYFQRLGGSRSNPILRSCWWSLQIYSPADSVLQGAGLNLAVETMEIGEKAEIHLAHEYGYGIKGAFCQVKLSIFSPIFKTFH